MNIELEVFKFIFEFLYKNKHLNVELDFSNDCVYVNNFPCSGFFDDKTLTLKVAVGNNKLEDWFGTFLHEMSHFEQWEEKCDAWVNSQPSDMSSDDLLDNWVLGIDFEDIETKIKNVAFVEYDCEIRTTEKLSKFPELFNKSEYIQKSNAYISFYKQLYLYRNWNLEGSASYKISPIWKNMPTEFLNFSDYWDTYKFENINWKLCFEKGE